MRGRLDRPSKIKNKKSCTAACRAQTKKKKVLYRRPLVKLDLGLNIFHFFECTFSSPVYLPHCMLVETNSAEKSFSAGNLSIGPNAEHRSTVSTFFRETVLSGAEDTDLYVTTICWTLNVWKGGRGIPHSLYLHLLYIGCTHVPGSHPSRSLSYCVICYC